MNKVILTILDGFGEAKDAPGNAITQADTPNIDRLRKEYPFGILQSSGEAVGLTAGSMGGSEVGHFTMGAGRIVPQFLLAINQDITSGAFFEKKELLEVCHYAKNNQKVLHLIGMISDKGVHSHIDHLFALLDLAKKEGLSKVYIHCISDGRDVRERSVKTFLEKIQNKIDSLSLGKIVSIIGRYYAMDRDKNWNRTEIAYQLLIHAKGKFFDDSKKAIDYFYEQDADLTDYYLPAISLDSEAVILEDDAVIFFNYRTDRTKQLTASFVNPDFNYFKRSFRQIHFICMGPYSDYAPIVYDVPKIKNNLAQYLSKNGIHQLRIAETEKYAHVTFFFNSQNEDAVDGEDHIMIHSPKVPSYDEKPEMSAYQITEAVLDALEDSKHEVIIMNFANCDLVGHSGNLQATIRAVEVVDDCVGQIYEKAMQKDYTLMLTADHGNADEMLYPDGSSKPAHSMNPVILLIADPKKKIQSVHDGGLADIAPTLLKILGLKPADEMTGKLLID